jgi:hypothetical protein
MGCTKDAAMIPYQVDPSLHPERRAPEQLDDGFSPPAGSTQTADPLQPHQEHPTAKAEPSWSAKSDF